jgi:DNA-3-methyladenine glycosylase II
LKSEFSGFFTAAKSSPYDAATWAVMAPRTSMRQAARLKMEIARELGDVVVLDGVAHSVFPSPAALAQLQKFPGLSDEKVSRLRAVADAAKAGALDVERLRAMHVEDALAELQEIRGVGPWAASHIYFRGVAPADALPTIEPRVLHGFAAAAGIAVPTADEFERAADAWRPFRMWVCVLLSRHLARTGNWRAPGLAKERAAAGRVLAKKTSLKERRSS